eukprot:10458466-Ditylum_brightwellii.AAC.1
MDSLDSVWDLDISKFYYFPTVKSGVPCGRLGCQQIAHVKESPFRKSLYVDDGAFLFATRADLQCGANLIFCTFAALDYKCT